MAQLAIREYDAKNMFFNSIEKKYTGIKISCTKDLEQLNEGKKYVIKPDMLFGKRGKLGLLGVGLSKSEISKWFQEKKGKEIEINGISGTLEHFLVEDFVPHQAEYYISFTAKRDYDEINFSFEGGVEIEENWEKVVMIKVPVNTPLNLPLLRGETGKKIPLLTKEGQGEVSQQIDNLLNSNSSLSSEERARVRLILLQLWDFYKNYGFTYLEVNPFCFDENGEVVLLDMVAKLDDQEIFRQKQHWGDLVFPNTFGFKENEAERYIKKLDGETGASLKMKILNPNAKIWTLLAGGGGSLVMTDTLGALGYADNIGNYGELSGNPTRDFTREYTRTLFGEMLKSSAKNKYLIIAGAIANFTNVATTFQGIIDILEEKQEDFRKQNITILVRRGGINEEQGLANLKQSCETLGIPAIITGSESYMTDILQNIK
ncbi:ATPase [Candidatus Gracilibacteria bacterium]|nr:ATPase [Candidatus Gracilibacteria bacterium]